MNNRPIQRIGDYNEQQQRKSDAIFCNVLAFIFMSLFTALFFYAMLQ